MNALMEFYGQQIQNKIASCGNSSHKALIENSFQQLRELNTSSFSNESWKYTSINGFLDKYFKITETSKYYLPVKTEPTYSFNLQYKIFIFNGRVHQEENSTLEPHKNKREHSGLLAVSLLEAMENFNDKLSPYLDKILIKDHCLHALNTSLFQNGVFINIPANKRIGDVPIVVCHWQDKVEQAIYTRNVIVIEEGAEVTLIEEYNGKDVCKYLTNSITEIYLAKNAKMTYYKVQQEGMEAYHFSHTVVQQHLNSNFRSHVVSLGGKIARNELNLHLSEPYSKCFMNGIYISNDTQHLDNQTSVIHKVGNCSSEQDYKGIMSAHSTAVFNGKIVVLPNAKQTEAKQQNKNLLLSKEAEINTKPQLDIFTDDVICSHGATVGQVDEDALFYFLSRGIDKDIAIEYLIKAFAIENLEKITDVEVAQKIASALTKKLG